MSDQSPGEALITDAPLGIADEQPEGVSTSGIEVTEHAPPQTEPTKGDDGGQTEAQGPDQSADVEPIPPQTVRIRANPGSYRLCVRRYTAGCEPGEPETLFVRNTRELTIEPGEALIITVGEQLPG